MTSFLLWLLSAAIAPTASPPRIKGEIVVTPERGATEREAVAASVTVITREQLEALPAQSLAEVVNVVPGITMYFDSGAAAGAPMVVARGFFGGGENEYVKLLVDGVPAGDIDSGLIDWRHIRVGGHRAHRSAARSRLVAVRRLGNRRRDLGLHPRRRWGNDERGELRLSGGTLGSREADLFYRVDAGPLRIGIDGLSATTDGYRDHPPPATAAGT